MRNFCRNLLSVSVVLAIAVFALAPPAAVNAQTSTTPTAKIKTVTSGATTTPAPVTTSGVPAPAATTTVTTTTAAPATPAPTKAPAPFRPKLIDVDGVSTSGLSKGSIDVYMSLTNKGKVDDALVGAETPLSDKIELVAVTDKKEAAGPLHVDLPLNKAVKLAEGDKFLRISGITTSPKDGEHFQMMLHFRSAPNVTADVVVHKKSSFFGM